MKAIWLIIAVLMLVWASVGQCQQTQPLTKEQIVERVQAIDRQLLMLEKQELVKQYQILESKEKAAAPKKEEQKKGEKK